MERDLKDRPLHSHGYLELMLVLSGEVLNHVEGEAFSYPGSTVPLKPFFIKKIRFRLQSDRLVIRFVSTIEMVKGMLFYSSGEDSQIRLWSFSGKF